MTDTEIEKCCSELLQNISAEDVVSSFMSAENANMHSSNLIGSPNGCNALGSPIQASSPQKLERGPGPEGDGDCASIKTRSIHSVLSPIIRHQQMQASILLQPPPPSVPNSGDPCSPAPVTSDSFLTNFEKSSPSTVQVQPYSLQQELLLTEKVGKMAETEARKLLTQVLLDNMGLRHELRTKDKRITAYKGQMLAILDWKASKEAHDEMDDDDEESDDSQESSELKRVSERTMIPQKTFRSSQEITVIEEVNGMRRSLSFIQEIASSFDLDNDTLRDRLKEGFAMTNQFVVGGLAGWTSALFVKKFGKLALSAAGGGLILLVYTARKGFVNVNYDSIYQEISKLCDETSAEDELLNNNELDVRESEEPNRSRESLDADINQLSALEKLKIAKNWVASHTYTVGGFVLTFAYQFLK